MIEYFSNAGLPFLNPPILVSLVYPLFLNFELPVTFFFLNSDALYHATKSCL